MSPEYIKFGPSPTYFMAHKLRMFIIYTSGYIIDYTSTNIYLLFYLLLSLPNIYFEVLYEKVC